MNWDEKLKMLMEQYEADAGIIYHYNSNDNFLYLVSRIGNFPEEMIPIMSKIPNGKGIAGETVASRKPVVANDLTGEDAPACARPLAKTLGVHGMICVPIFQGQDVVGAIGLGCYQPHEFTQSETDELLATGRSLAKDLALEK